MSILIGAGGDYTVRNCSSSGVYDPADPLSLYTGSFGKAMEGSATHDFGWRDLFDIAVRWRRFSEPNDPVWYAPRVPVLFPVCMRVCANSFLISRGGSIV